jgi:2'-5' RNA ligase
MSLDYSTATMYQGNGLTLQPQRLFLALLPDEETQERLVTHANQWKWPAACAQYASAEWHVTLHFIGNVDAGRVGEIAASANVPFRPFELVLDQPKLWPHGMAALCASQVPMPLQALHARLGCALVELELPVETRSYQPHVTLARHAEGAVPPSPSAPVVWWARSFALVVSTGDRNQRYRVIHAYF